MDTTRLLVALPPTPEESLMVRLTTISQAFSSCRGHTSPETQHDHDLRCSPDATGVAGPVGTGRCKTYVKELPNMEGLKDDPKNDVLYLFINAN